MDEPGHVPVLVDAVRRLLAPGPGRRVLDCTLGLGGHAEVLLAAGAQVLGVDRDPEARARAGERLAVFGSACELRAGAFASVAADLVASGERFDGLLADLGVSSLQLDDPARGFSIRSPCDADMRMGDDVVEGALELLDRLDQDGLAQLLRRFGEEPRSRRVARALLAARCAGACSGRDLAEAVRGAVPGHHERHPALRAFQALRIAVNGELEQLEALLELAPRLLRPGGCAVLISFHSLEDRLVKRTFRAQFASGLWAGIARRVLVAEPDEIARNRRAAPAKLRWARAPAPEGMTV